MRKIKEGIELNGNERQAVLNSLQIIRKPFLKPAAAGTAQAQGQKIVDTNPDEDHFI